MFRQKKVIALIPTGGSGARMGTDVKKQYLNLEGIEILNWTLKHISSSEWIDEIIVIVPKEDILEVTEKISVWIQVDCILKPIKVIPGGKTRQESVYLGLQAMEKYEEYVLIHDGVRPFVPIAFIERYLETLEQNKSLSGVVAGQRVTDTLKKVDKDHLITGTVDRDTIWSVQTPQVFRCAELIRAHAFALAHEVFVTDDAALLETLCESIAIVESPSNNIKITKPYDLELAKSILKSYPLE